MVTAQMLTKAFTLLMMMLCFKGRQIWCLQLAWN